MLDRRAILRILIAFVLAIVFWSAFSRPYERAVARAAEIVLRAFERPAVTRLEAVGGTFRVERRDFPPGSPRPGLPSADLHFNFVLLVSLFALDRRPWEASRVARLLIGVLLLFLVHVLALAVQVQSVYVSALGPWSAARYGPVARNVWGAAFHFYTIAGRFAAPFAIWWPLRRVEKPVEEVARPPRRRKKRRKN